MSYEKQLGVLNLFGGFKKDMPLWLHKNLKALAIKEQLRLFFGRKCDVCGNHERITKYNGGHHDGECITCKSIEGATRRAKEKDAWANFTMEERQRIVEIYADRLRKKIANPQITFEVHHIQPYCNNGKHHPDNLVVLTHEQHIRVHDLLRERKNDLSSTKWKECLKEALQD